MDTDLYNLMINSSGFLILPVFFSLGTGAQLDSQSIINLLGRELGVYGNRQKKSSSSSKSLLYVILSNKKCEKTKVWPLILDNMESDVEKETFTPGKSLLFVYFGVLEGLN